MQNLSEKAKGFMSYNPTVIGHVAGVTFYECPFFGDEMPLRYISKEGKLKCSGYYELPSIEEALELPGL